MSTPTSPERDDRTAGGRPAEGPVEPLGAPPQPATTETTGQHATARPYPPTAPAATAASAQAGGTERPLDAGAAERSGIAEHAPLDDRSRADEELRRDERVAEQQRLDDERRLAEERRAEEERRVEDERLREERRLEQARRDLPEPPRRPGAGRHLLGALLGLVLTPVALLLVGIGTSRLSDVASGEPTADALGLTLLLLGTLLLAVVVLLGAWSPAVPLVGGLVWGVALGLAYLVVPGVMQDTVDTVAGDRVLPAAVEQLTDSATSGQLLVTGTLLVAAGIAAAVGRRAGRRWAERKAEADRARIELERTSAERLRSFETAVRTGS